MNKTRYFTWLLNKVYGRSKVYTQRYSDLLSYLHQMEFRWDRTITTDENRADDGVNLRLLYFNEVGSLYGENLTREDTSRPCSVLEMLIALSCRIETDIMGEPGDDHTEKWFWEMIDNLGLSGMTNNMFDPVVVNNAIGKWLGRSYKASGKGGLFPLKKNYNVDQRRVPIWDQMGTYLVENY